LAIDSVAFEPRVLARASLRSFSCGKALVPLTLDGSSEEIVALDESFRPLAGFSLEIPSAAGLSPTVSFSAAFWFNCYQNIFCPFSPRRQDEISYRVSHY
jgi:hypothetical protein